MTFHLPMLPEELPYSYMVRWAGSSGYPDPRSAMKILVGTDNYQFRSNFPAYIPSLCLLTGIGGHELLKQHTILPFFHMFCDSRQYQSAYDNLLNGKSKDLHTQLSLVSGRFTQSDNLAYCATCVTEDKNHYGVGYWHRSHQVPGQILCVRHRQRLKSCKVKRRDFILPDNVSFDNGTCVTQAEQTLSTLLNAILTINKSIDTLRLTNVYFCKLAELGYVTPAGRLRVKLLFQELKSFWQPIVNIPVYARIFDDNSVSPFPASLFYGSKTVVQPLKHALLMGLLFRTLETFYKFHDDAVAGEIQTAAPTNVPTKNTPSFIPQMDQGIVYGLREGESMRTLSSRFGVSITKIKKLAILNSLILKSRAQRLFEPERKLIIQMANAGDSTQKIAVEFKCSVGAIEQIIGQQPGLVKLRKELRFTQRRNEHRTKVLNTVKSSCTRNQVRLQVNASYTYLYKHDRVWLYRTLPPAIARSNRHSRINH